MLTLMVADLLSACLIIPTMADHFRLVLAALAVSGTMSTVSLLGMLSGMLGYRLLSTCSAVRLRNVANWLVIITLFL